MKKTILIAAVSALAAASVTAFAEQYVDYTPQKGAWQFTEVKVEPAHIDDYLVGLREARLRREDGARVAHGDLVTEAGQGERLVPGATADVEHRARRLRQVGEELLVQDERPDPALDGRVRTVDERVCQR